VVERVSTHRDETLTLRDVLATPQYNVVFRKYMEDLFSSDLYSFVWCAQAYKRLSTPAQRADAAAVMYEEFLAPRYCSVGLAWLLALCCVVLRCVVLCCVVLCCVVLCCVMRWSVDWR
jgi:hypothetical protein